MVVESLLKRFHTYSESGTQEIAADLAGRINSPVIIILNGNLGAGKSVFARALIRALCGNPSLEVPSPTFSLMQTYDAANGAIIYHFDLYRLSGPEEIYELGWEEALGGIVIVEWPERLGTLLPASHIAITISNVADSPESRDIVIERHTA